MKFEQPRGISDLRHEKFSESSSDLFGDDMIYNAARHAYTVTCRITKALKHDLQTAAFWTVDHVEEALNSISSDHR